MKCTVIPCGSLRANCCVLQDSAGNAAVADPGGSFQVIKDFLESAGLTVRLILLTHGHDDHTGALKQLRDFTGAPVCVHELDAYRLPVEPDRLLTDGEELEAGELKIKVIHTPGHTEGSVCFLCENLMLSGDTLFRESIGRTDLPGGDSARIMESLDKLMSMDCGDVTVIPGHGNFTTLEHEREFNPFIS